MVQICDCFFPIGYHGKPPFKNILFKIDAHIYDNKVHEVNWLWASNNKYRISVWLEMMDVRAS